MSFCITLCLYLILFPLSKFLEMVVLRSNKQFKNNIAGCRWLMPIILATEEAEIRRIPVLKPAPANSSRDPILPGSQGVGWLREGAGGGGRGVK
jgi:hypothetical protein